MFDEATSSRPRLAAVAPVLPPYRYRQDELTRAICAAWRDREDLCDHLLRLHEKVCVAHRHLALPIEELLVLTSFTARNEAFIRVALDLAQEALHRALGAAGLAPRDVDHIFFVSTTGIATPSIEALLMNRMDLRSDLKRTPIFGLGCAGGVAAVARAADYLLGHPDQVAVVLSVELCSLTAQWNDHSMANAIATGLFGDGAAAVILCGAKRQCSGPAVAATRSIFYRDTENVMGWRIGASGFQLILSAAVPDMVTRHLGEDVDRFLCDLHLRRSDITIFISHTGGPKVLRAIEGALALGEEDLMLARRSLRNVGNLSSAGVLHVLHDTLNIRHPRTGTCGLLFAMGPGFCTELVLLQW